MIIIRRSVPRAYGRKIIAYIDDMKIQAVGYMSHQICCQQLGLMISVRPFDCDYRMEYPGSGRYEIRGHQAGCMVFIGDYGEQFIVGSFRHQIGVPPEGIADGRYSVADAYPGIVHFEIEFIAQLDGMVG